MIKKTGREIYKLRKAKLGLGEPDKHMFREKMAFLTTSTGQVPPLLLGSEDPTDPAVDPVMTLLGSSRSSTLKHVTPSAEALAASAGNDEAVTSGNSSSSSTCSTPTPHLKARKPLHASVERFSYEIDPDIGVIV